MSVSVCVVAKAGLYRRIIIIHMFRVEDNMDNAVTLRNTVATIRQRIIMNWVFQLF